MNAFVFKPDQKSNDGFESDRTNGDRADGAQTVLEHYKKAILGEDGPIDETCVQDLISDLFHFCDREGWHVDGIIEGANLNWEGER